MRPQIHHLAARCGGRRYAPNVFTEHGAIMAASLLSSARTIDASVYAVRAFVQQHELLASNKDLARQLKGLVEHRTQNP